MAKLFAAIRRGLCPALFAALLVCAQASVALAQNGTAAAPAATNATQAQDSGPKALGADAAFLREGNATAAPELSGAGEVTGALPTGNGTGLHSESNSGSGSDTISSPGQEDETPVFSWGGYFKGIGALFLILAALWGVVWFLRKRGSLPGGGGLPRDSFSVEAQLALSPKQKIVLVRFLNSRLLLGVTDQRITLLKEVEGPDGRGESTKSTARSFADVIADASQKDDAS